MFEIIVCASVFVLYLLWQLPKALDKAAEIYATEVKIRWFEEPRFTILALEDIPEGMLSALNLKKQALNNAGYDFIGAIRHDLNEYHEDIRALEFLFSSQVKKTTYSLLITETMGLRNATEHLISRAKKGHSVETKMSKQCSRLISSREQNVGNFVFRVIPSQRHFSQFEQNHLSHINNRFSPGELATLQNLEQAIEWTKEIFRNHNDTIKESGFRFSSMLFFNSLTFNPFLKALQYSIIKATFKKLRDSYPGIVFRK